MGFYGGFTGSYCFSSWPKLFSYFIRFDSVWLGYYGYLLGLTEFNRVFLVSNQVIIGFNWFFCLFLLGFTWFYWFFSSWSRFLTGCARFNWFLTVFTVYRVSKKWFSAGFIGLYRWVLAGLPNLTLPGFTDFDWSLGHWSRYRVATCYLELYQIDHEDIVRYGAIF